MRERKNDFIFNKPEDGLILPVGERLVDQVVNHPKRVFAAMVGLMAIIACTDMNSREAACLPPSSCHQRLWEASNPGSDYPHQYINIVGIRFGF